MAMIQCKECGTEISDKAAACPHCGNPMNQLTPPPVKKLEYGDRKCLKCGYVGQMKTWLRNYNAPQFITVVLLLFYIIPGVIFIAWGWGKYKCPQCGSVGNNTSSDVTVL